MCTHGVGTMPICRFLADRDLSFDVVELVSDAMSRDGSVRSHTNDFLVSAVHVEDLASQVMSSSVRSTILPSTRMLCKESWNPEEPKDASIRDNPNLLQFRKKKTLDIDDVTEAHEVVSVYPHTGLILQMAVDARRCSALHKPDC